MPAIADLRSPPKSLTLTLTFLLVPLLGVLDYLSGPQLSFAGFYLIPVSATAWVASRRLVFLNCIQCSVTWLLADFASGDQYSYAAIPYWNAAMCLIMFIVVGELISRLISWRRELEATVGERTHELRAEIEARNIVEQQNLRQIRRLRALREIDVAINASFDRRLTMDILLNRILDVLQIDAADILVADSQSSLFTFAASRGFRTPALAHTRLRMGDGYAGKAALDREMVFVPDLPNNLATFARASLLQDEDFKAFLAMPLVAKGRVAGVLEIFQRSPLAPDEEWFSSLEALAGQAAIALDNTSLFNELYQSKAALTIAYDQTLEGWSRALDLRDRETEGHTQRVTDLAVRLALECQVPEEQLADIRRGALLHDIGKMGVPDSILHKPGPLTDEEWVVMRRHPKTAFELLSPIEFLRPALDIPYCHHEKWDGSGYPRGLRGEQIPVAARIFALADVWDALRSDRPYRSAWPPEKVRAHIKDETGTHFDSKIAGVFLEMDWGQE